MTISLNAPSINPATTAPQLLLEFAGQYRAPLTDELYSRAQQSENPELLEQYVNTWTTTFGPLNHHDDGDFENFVETMARFDSAWRAFGPQNTMIRHLTSEHESSLHRFDGVVVVPTDEVAAPAPDFVFGPVSSWGSGHGQDAEQASDPADNYWHIPAFKELSARKWMLAGYFPDDPNHPDILEAIQELFDQGVRRFVVKGTSSKTMLEIFELTVRPTEMYSSSSEIPGEITDGVQHLEGRSEVFLVQEFISMNNEYRFFMAGNQPASGAACIEDFTPLDSRGTAFDVRVERRRHGGAIREDQEVVHRMLEFAQSAGKLMHEQAPALGTAWVMDLAINPTTDQVVLIELNPARNSGLYASSPTTWMSGVREWLEQSR